MNNKKLFKGALVLFASILMAVSCSNKNTNPDDDSSKPPDNPSGNTKDKISVNVGVLGDKSTTTFTMYSDDGASKLDSAIIPFAGTDKNNLEAKKTGGSQTDGKYIVSIKSVDGLVKTDLPADAPGVKGNLAAKESLNDVFKSGDSPANQDVIKLTDDLKLSIASGDMNKVFDASASATANTKLDKTEWGIVKVVLEIKDPSKKKEDITVDVYVALGNKNS